MVSSKKMRPILVFAITAGGLATYQNCAPTTFGSLNQSSEVIATGTAAGDTMIAPCRPVSEVTAPLKIIVAVDHTGSNGSNIHSTHFPNGKFALGLGSDPDQAFRQKSLMDLVNSVAVMHNIQFNLMIFQDLQTITRLSEAEKQSPNTKSYINVGGDDQSPAFTDADTMKKALLQMRDLWEDGDTEYFTVLDLIKKAIETDRDLKNGTQNYAALIVSDGEPSERFIVDSAGVQTTRRYKEIDVEKERKKIKEQDRKDLINKVSELVSIFPGHISLSTIFYNSLTQEDRAKLMAQDPLYDPIDPEAPGILKEIAQAGRGQFANANIEGADNVVLNNLIQVPSAICMPK